MRGTSAGMLPSLGLLMSAGRSPELLLVQPPNRVEESINVHSERCAGIRLDLFILDTVPSAAKMLSHFPLRTVRTDR